MNRNTKNTLLVFSSLSLLTTFSCTTPQKKPDDKRTLTRNKTKIPTSFWPTFQGNNQRTGTKDVPELEDPRIAWKTNVGIQSWLNNPIVVHDRVFVGSSGSIWNKSDKKDGVHAIDLSTGKPLWFVPTNNDVNGVAYDKGIVVATSDDGKIYALDWHKGTILWTHTTKPKSKVYTNPLIQAGLAYVGTSQGDILALDLFSGKLVWTQQLNGAIRGGLSSDGLSIYAATDLGHVAAYTPKGKKLWTVFTGDVLSYDQPSIYAAPTIVGDHVVLTYARDTTYSEAAIFALKRSDGSLVWNGVTYPKSKKNRPLPWSDWANVRSSPSSFKNLLTYAEPYSNHIVSVDNKKGMWRLAAKTGECSFQHWSSPAQSNQIVYLPRFDGAIYAFSNDYGLARWRIFIADADSAGSQMPEPNKTKGDSCLWSPNVGKGIYASPALTPQGDIIVGTGQGYLFKITDRSRWTPPKPSQPKQ